MQKPPIIPKIHDHNRPLWSVMIPTYNSQDFIEEALRGVLVQDAGREKMQIEVIDDCSSDNTEEIVKKIGGDRVKYYRHAQNIGSLKNFEFCLNKSKGYLIHLLHSDDKVLPGFYGRMTSLFENHPEIGAGFCRHTYIDESGKPFFLSTLEKNSDGILENWIQKLGVEQRIQTPSIVVRREVYERLGAFYKVHYGEDWEMWLRIAAHYPIGYVAETLAEYRRHESSISGKAIRSGQNMRDLQKVMDISYYYFPEEERDNIRKKALKFYASYGVTTANYIWSRYKDKKGVAAQVLEALKMNKSPVLLLRILKLYTKILLKL